MKRCSTCGLDRPINAFWVDRKRGRPTHRCKECTKLAAREWRARNPGYGSAKYRANRERSRANHYARKYGITPECYDRMLEEQQGACAVCRRPEPDGKRLDVDHCHSTGRVRGLLCTNCNRMIGHAWDDPERLTQAAAYLVAPLAAEFLGTVLDVLDGRSAFDAGDLI